MERADHAGLLAPVVGAPRGTGQAAPLAKSAAGLDARKSASGDGRSFGRDWDTGASAQTAGKVPRLARRSRPHQAHALCGNQKREGTSDKTGSGSGESATLRSPW